MDLKNLLGLNKPDIKKMEREKDIKGLTRLLKFNNDESVRREAAFAIGKITDPATSQDSDAQNKTTEETVDELINSLKSDDVILQKQSARELVDIGKPALKSLIKSLHDQKWRVRWYSAEILGEIGDKKAVEPLIVALDDENNGVRSNSMIALVEIGDASVSPLINAMAEGNWQVRWQAAEALGSIGSKKAVKPLIKRLKDENSWVKKTAADALGNIGDKKAGVPLKELLNDDDSEVQEAVLGALEKIGY